MHRLSFLGFAVALLLAPGCDLLDDDDELQPLPFENLAQVDCLGVVDPGTRVFRDEPAWKSFWLDHVTCTGDAGSPLPPPAVDFGSGMLLAVHWGAGYSGCSSAVEAIQRIDWRGDRIEVRVGPLPDLGDCLALVEPIQVVRCQRSELPVTFVGAPG